MAWKRENSRGRLSSAPSIEETGLDAVLYGERQPFFTPREEDGATGGKRANQQDGNEGDRIIRLGRGQSTPPLLQRLGGENAPDEIRLRKQGSVFGYATGNKPSEDTFAEVRQRFSTNRKSAGLPEEVVGLNSAPSPPSEHKEEKALPIPRGRSGTYRSSSAQRTSSSHLNLDRLSGIEEGDLTDESAASSPRNDDEHGDEHGRLLQSFSGARNRWRRLKHTAKFASHMTQLRQGAADLIEEDTNEALHRDNAGVTGAAASDGEKIGNIRRLRGRKGMEDMLLQHDKSFLTMLQDFYVACLKMPTGQFLLGVFLAPVALGLLFTPLYSMDMGGLSFDGTTLAETIPEESSVAAATQRLSALLHVFLYALSLSTTFGGSPVVALSPFCLLVANVNTLMAQFLFVFLSGGVFSRMSQPSHPMRCSKKAIIRGDDSVTTPEEDKNRVFAVRLVLTGPAPCELVDAKICLTFRIFVKLQSGSVFCSTQDLELVRPEVSYLRYGLVVRHIIDKESPLFGHTMESLKDGDASFSLTIMGLERTSMQSIFHIEYYFICDGDVVWDGDYEDFIHVNRSGQRVLDHSKIDSLKPFKVGGIVTRAIHRMESDAVDAKK